MFLYQWVWPHEGPHEKPLLGLSRVSDSSGKRVAPQLTYSSCPVLELRVYHTHQRGGVSKECRPQIVGVPSRFLCLGSHSLVESLDFPSLSVVDPEPLTCCEHRNVGKVNFKTCSDSLTLGKSPISTGEGCSKCGWSQMLPLERLYISILICLQALSSAFWQWAS